MIILNKSIQQKIGTTRLIGGVLLAYKKDKKSMVRQIQERLESKLRIGHSKHEEKIAGISDKYIYSYSTFRSYMQNCNYFIKWAKEKYGCKTIDEARPYVDEYLQKLIDEGRSGHTQKLRASSLAKLYGCSTRDFRTRTDSRLRENIKRSRNDCVRDKHFSKTRNKELIEFCRGTGLRRVELEKLRPEQLVQKEDGSYWLDIKGKGGRERLAPIMGSPEQIKAIVDRIEASEGLVWGKVHNAADIHGYRAEYATRVYKAHARAIKDIPYDKVNKGSLLLYQSEVYHCRGDLKGVAYDKKAMLVASQALGHDRISVIAAHYIRL